MNKLLSLMVFCFISVISFSQLPYTWTAGVNPGWTSSDGVLSWKPGCTVVTTNCVGNYTNNINSVYTSPVIDASCTNASTVSITFTASGNAEFGWDFLFIEYSLDGGVTWTNPYGAGTGWTGNFGAGTTIPAVTTPTSSNFMFRFNFSSDNSVVSSGYNITDFDIVCNTVLPIELVDFDGSNDNNVNNIYWVTATEINNDYFELQKSEDGYNYTTLTTIKGSGNSNTPIMYEYRDINPFDEITYYRLKQVDFDGQFEYHNVIAIKTIHDGNNSDAIIYPNPNNGFIQIGDMNLNDIKFISITNSIGEIVYSAESYNGNIDISNLTNGIYLIRINANGNLINRKIIKK